MRSFWKNIAGITLVWQLAGWGQAQAGHITGSYSNLALGSAVNLSNEGPADWIHWGLSETNVVDRLRLVPPQISNYTLLAGPDGYAEVFQLGDSWNGYSWTNGTPSLTASNSPTGVWSYSLPVGEGTGFRLTAPADTRSRILKVYVGVYSGDGEITATLSDSSATPYVESSLGHNGNGLSRVYVLNYAANSSGQNLRVDWTLKKKQGGATQAPNVQLHAAALRTPGINIPPGVWLVSPANSAQFAAGQQILLETISGDADGAITNVSFFQNGNKIGASTNAPYSFAWEGAPAGIHQLTAVATDDVGGSTTSPPIEAFVYGTGGTLSGSISSPLPASVDLTLEGTSDWIHWGLTTANSVDRMAGGTLITNYSRLGTNPVQRFADGATAWTWANGTPTASSPGSPTGIFVYGRTNGFKLMIPASGLPQMLKVYGGMYGAQIGFRAYLSDYSAPAYYGVLSNLYETVDATFTVQFSAASSNQLLVVDLQNQEMLDPLFGNLRLMSATLQVDNTVVRPFSLLDIMPLGNQFLFSFDSQSNHLYTIESLDPVVGPPWTLLGDLPGTGSRMTVTNNQISPGTLLYRVRAQ